MRYLTLARYQREDHSRLAAVVPLPTGPWPGAWINTDAALTTPMMTRSELTSGHDTRSSPSERPPNARDCQIDISGLGETSSLPDCLLQRGVKLDLARIGHVVDEDQLGGLRQDIVILRLRRGSSQPSRYRICRVVRRPIRHPDKKARSGRRRRCGQKKPMIYFAGLSSFPPNVK